MIQKKICMLGGYAVGKTSLVSRFVTSMFSDTYLTTVGVKIDKKSVAARGNEVDLIIWDIYGEDEFQKMRTSYLRGASGYLLVADVTRRATLDTAQALHALVEQSIGPIPFTLVLNKTDLLDRWDLDDAVVEQLKKRWRVIQTSAKTGDHVDEAFVDLASEMVVG
jgi:small GTP-binding protein